MCTWNNNFKALLLIIVIIKLRFILFDSDILRMKVSFEPEFLYLKGRSHMPSDLFAYYMLHRPIETFGITSGFLKQCSMRWNVNLRLCKTTTSLLSVIRVYANNLLLTLTRETSVQLGKNVDVQIHYKAVWASGESVQKGFGELAVTQQFVLQNVSDQFRHTVLYCKLFTRVLLYYSTYFRFSSPSWAVMDSEGTSSRSSMTTVGFWYYFFQVPM